MCQSQGRMEPCQQALGRIPSPALDLDFDFGFKSKAATGCASVAQRSLKVGARSTVTKPKTGATHGHCDATCCVPSRCAPLMESAALGIAGQCGPLGTMADALVLLRRQPRHDWRRESRECFSRIAADDGCDVPHRPSDELVVRSSGDERQGTHILADAFPHATGGDSSHVRLQPHTRAVVRHTRSPVP